MKKKCSKAKILKAREKWLLALESGKFKRGTKTLKYRDDKGVVRYCSLGVACEVIGPEIELYTVCNSSSTLPEYYTYGEVETSAFLPSELVEYLGLYDNVGSNIQDKGYNLITLNDIKNCSFKKIAAIIRKNPEKYFRNL